MIHIENNECPICLDENLEWNLNICKSDMHMFKCGHGTCKSCFIKLKNSREDFRCPCCYATEQVHYAGFQSETTEKWTTFSEWYNDYEIFIKAGSAKNVIKNTTFGKQLLRLVKESKKIKKQEKLEKLEKESKKIKKQEKLEKLEKEGKKIIKQEKLEKLENTYIIHSIIRCC